MNNDLCNIISKVFAYKTNVMKMEKGRLTDCIDMRYHTKGLIKDQYCVHWGSRIQSHYIHQQKIVVAEVDRKRILRELQTCPYLISGCWKASMRPCPEHSLPIWHYSDSYQKHIRNRRCGTSISIFSQPHYRNYLNSPHKIGSWGVFKSISRTSLKIKLSL